jgi:hypothetical protein
MKGNNGDNLNNVRREASRYFRNKTREYLEDKINELATNSMNINIRDLYREINEFIQVSDVNVHTIRCKLINIRDLYREIN